MDFVELLTQRRTIRDFEDREVPLELVREMINDSIKAPNAGNRQPWSFIIVNNREWIKRLSDESKRTYLAEIKTNPDSPLKRYYEILKIDEYNVYYNAPCLIYIVGPAKVETLSLDCALSACYFMFSAASRGLGTCWIALGGGISDPEMRKELGLPDDYRIIAPIILGYPGAIPPMPERKDPRILKVLS